MIQSRAVTGVAQGSRGAAAKRSTSGALRAFRIQRPMIYAPGEVQASSTGQPEAPALRRGPFGAERRRRLTHRAAPLLVLAGVSFVVGLVFGALHVPAERSAANRFVGAWER